MRLTADGKPWGIPPALDTREKAQGLYDKHLTVKGIADACSLNWKTVVKALKLWEIEYEQTPRKRAARMQNRRYSEERELTSAPIFSDLRDFPEDTTETWKALLKWQHEVQGWSIEQEQASCEIKTKLPVAICFRGDWHLGNEHTDYETFLRHRDAILATPGLYSIELGDLIDGFVKPAMPTGWHEALLRVKMQRHLVWDTCQHLKGRVLAVVSGQHDHWGVHQADFDPVEWLAHDRAIPYLGHGGLLTLAVGKQTYTIQCRHTYRYNSVYNATHSIKQFWRFQGDSDIGCHADRHVPAVELVPWKGEMRIALRPGTYKPTDDFMESHGFPKGLPIMPTVILWPDQHRMEAHWNLEAGAEALARWRR